MFERVFEEESAKFDLPSQHLGVSINIVGGTLLRFGNEEQLLRHMPRVLRGQEVFVQLLSEPSGGSDLAGLLTRADRDGTHFVLNGQKTWSSGADHADFALCPARTDWSVPKHQGISIFIIDLKSEGVDIRPILQIEGSSEFCEEFLTDVLVDERDLVGQENEGWKVVRGLLEIEHSWAGRHNTGRRALGNVDSLRALARQSPSKEVDPGIRRSIAALHVDIRVHDMLTQWVGRQVATGAVSATHGSLLKISSDNLIQKRTEVALAVAGARGIVWDAEDSDSGAWSYQFLNSRSASIAGGSREMQRNHVAESVLGLPRENDPFRGVPFAEVPHN
jgi:alkylation response protein AidB-like acyl-CoA dehydrogenase